MEIFNKYILELDTEN